MEIVSSGAKEEEQGTSVYQKSIDMWLCIRYVHTLTVKATVLQRTFCFLIRKRRTIQGTSDLIYRSGAYLRHGLGMTLLEICLQMLLSCLF